MFTLEELKSELDYDPLTGIFTWKVKRRGIRVGKKAGCLMSNGYLLIRFKRTPVLAHRLAFFYMKGRWPASQIDHKNRIRNDNRWENLREATPSENNSNKTIKERDLPKGIYLVTRKGRKGIWFLAIFSFQNKRYSNSFRERGRAEEWLKRKKEEICGGFFE